MGQLAAGGCPATAMRCPRCRHITHEELDVCPSCGHGYALATEQPDASALSLPTASEPPAPLIDLTLDPLNKDRPKLSPPESEVVVHSSLSRRAAAGGVVVLAGRQASSRPLSVRRRTPRAPKLRSEGCPTAATPRLEFERLGGSAVDHKTPSEQVVRRGTAALVGPRLGACAVDLVLLAAVDVAVLGLTVRLAGLSWEAIGSFPGMPLAVFLGLLDIGYLMALTALGGQTIGKMVLGLRVVHDDGMPVTVVGAVTRTVAYGVSVLPAGLGLLGLLFGSGRAFHDYLAHTRVVKVS